MTSEYLIGVDLGQAHDYTAICVVERHQRPVSEPLPTTVGAHRPRTESAYQVRHLDRLPLGTPYPEQVEHVTRVVQQLQQEVQPTGSRLVVDATGVGRAVVDMLRQSGHQRLTAVTIHAGEATTRDGRDYRVPKRELVSVLQVLLQTRRLAVAAALPHADTLTREMLAFKVTMTAKGKDTYGNDWRQNPHDDLVLAVALAAWAGERGTRAPAGDALRRLAAW